MLLCYLITYFFHSYWVLGYVFNSFFILYFVICIPSIDTTMLDCCCCCYQDGKGELALLLMCWMPLFIHFKFRDSVQDPVLNVQEIVFSNISIEGGVVYPYVHGLLYGLGQAAFFSAYNFKVLHCCFMATAILMCKYWRWGLQMFFKSFTKMFFLILLYIPPHSQSSHNCSCKWYCFSWP